jgi:hypothetical protein
MKLVMKGSTGCVMGTYDLGLEGSDDYEQNVFKALREFRLFMQPGDTLEVVATHEEEELV